MEKVMAYPIGIKQVIDKKILVINVALKVKKFSSMFTI
tara:strand:+ start:612 stop:725 length:114 start_codon:yes stop_codon:yes gene_type:complete